MATRRVVKRVRCGDTWVRLVYNGWYHVEVWRPDIRRYQGVSRNFMAEREAGLYLDRYLERNG